MVPSPPSGSSRRKQVCPNARSAFTSVERCRRDGSYASACGGLESNGQPIAIKLAYRRSSEVEDFRRHDPNVIHDAPNFRAKNARMTFGLTLQLTLQTTPQRRRTSPRCPRSAGMTTALRSSLKSDAGRRGSIDPRASLQRRMARRRKAFAPINEKSLTGRPSLIPSRLLICLPWNRDENAFADRSGGVPANPSGGVAAPREARARARRQGREVLGVSRVRSCRVSAVVLCFLSASVASDSEKGVR